MKLAGSFQFHLSTLFIAVTVACAIFALISCWGYGGFVERVFGALSFTAIFYPLIELYYWWRENVEILRREEPK
jgi:hypothetical protein